MPATATVVVHPAATLCHRILVNSGPVTKRFVIAAVVVVGQGLVSNGCRCGHGAQPYADLESDVQTVLAAQGLTVVAHCEAGVAAGSGTATSAPPACTITAPDGSHLALVINETADDWQWALPPRSVDSHAVATSAGAKYAELYPTVPTPGVLCGPQLRVLADDEQIDCDGPDGSHVLVTLVDTTLRFEVLTDPAALAARRNAGHDAELVAASRALDSRETTSEEAGEDGMAAAGETGDAALDANPTSTP